MNDDFMSAIEYLEKYTNAIIEGTSRFVGFLPTMIQNHIQTLASKRLSEHTADKFVDAVIVKPENNLLIITLDPEAWLPNALETGLDPYDMKSRLQTSPKAKMSKQGMRYMVIPMPAKKGAQGSMTIKGQHYQAMIDKALTKPVYKAAKTKVMLNGNVTTMEELISKDPETKGMYRTKTYKSAEAMAKGDKPISTQHTIFRVMSEKFPEKWHHPGLAPVLIFRDTEAWVYQRIPEVFSTFLDDAINKIQ